MGIIMSSKIYTAPNPTPIFHMLTIENFKNVLCYGGLLCRNLLVSSGIKCDDISYGNIQERRHQIYVNDPPGGTLHDYVPFYFAPRSPMLYTLMCGNVRSNFEQKNVIYLVTSAQKVAASGMEYVFYNAHAIMALATCFNTLSDLNKIDWKIFLEYPIYNNTGYNLVTLPIPAYCTQWSDIADKPEYANRKSLRQAEFNVKNKVDINLFDCIVTHNIAKQKEVEDLLLKYGISIPVFVVPSWYY